MALLLNGQLGVCLTKIECFGHRFHSHLREVNLLLLEAAGGIVSSNCAQVSAEIHRSIYNVSLNSLCSSKWPAGKWKLCLMKSSHGTISFCSPLFLCPSFLVPLIYLETVVLQNHFTNQLWPLRERRLSTPAA